MNATILALLLGGACLAGGQEVGEGGVGGHGRRLLSKWDGVLPPPAPRGINEFYNPATGTADASWTWGPVYPTPYYVEKASILFEPACPMKEILKDVQYTPVKDCLLSERRDVAAQLTIEYAIVQGPKVDGYKSIGDAPSEDSPCPIVRSVTDGDGTKLQYKVYRQGKEWWVHYTFAKPTAKRQFYTVVIQFQLRWVLTGSMFQGNTFRAHWMQEWNSPVKRMHLLFSFPQGFFLEHFDVKPGTSLQGDDEPSQVTSVCCGEEARPSMERCTNDDELGQRWAKGGGACANQTIQLATTLAVSKRGGGDPEDGVPLSEVYRIEFSPGIVDDVEGEAVNRSDHTWVFILLGILLFPAFGALVYFTYTIGRPSASDDGWGNDLYQKAA